VWVGVMSFENASAIMKCDVYHQLIKESAKAPIFPGIFVALFPSSIPIVNSDLYGILTLRNLMPSFDFIE
jgi:hypothetical protein